MKEMKIENWSLRTEDVDPYRAPETIGRVIVGDIYNSPDFSDGTRITTGTAFSSIGRRVNCRSDSRPGFEVFVLGKIDKKYREWMKTQNIAYNPKNPIKVVDRQLPVIMIDLNAKLNAALELNQPEWSE